MLLGSDARKMGVKVSSGVAAPCIVASPEAELASPSTGCPGCRQGCGA